MNSLQFILIVVFFPMMFAVVIVIVAIVAAFCRHKRRQGSRERHSSQMTNPVIGCPSHHEDPKLNGTCQQIKHLELRIVTPVNYGLTDYSQKKCSYEEVNQLNETREAIFTLSV